MSFDEEQVALLKLQVDEMVVEDEGGYDYSGAMHAKLKEALKFIDEQSDPNIKRLHLVHKAAIKDKKDLQAPLLAVREAVERARVRYREILRSQQEGQVKLFKEAVKDQMAGQAVKLIEAGDEEGARALVEHEVKGPPIQEMKFKGVRRLKRWRIKDWSKINREYMQLNTVLINNTVRKYGKEAEAEGMVGGIEVYEVDSE